MKKSDSKALEFIYQDTQIHFLLSNDDNVMVNATEMAKAFGKRVDNYLRLDTTKKLIEALKKNLESLQLETEKNYFDSSHVSEQKIIFSNNKATYFNRILALDFASWLDLNFKIWIYQTIDKILFGHYKEHWDAHMLQENAKGRMETAKKKLLNAPTQEDAIAYFEAENEYKTAKNAKLKAIQSQYKLFDSL